MEWLEMKPGGVVEVLLRLSVVRLFDLLMVSLLASLALISFPAKSRTRTAESF